MVQAPLVTREIVLEPPYLNPMPVKPNIRVLVILFTSAGIVISLCLVFILYFLHDRLSVYSVSGLFRNVFRVKSGDLEGFLNDLVRANSDARSFLFIVPRREIDEAMISSALPEEGIDSRTVANALEEKAWLQRWLFSGWWAGVFSDGLLPSSLPLRSFSFATPTETHPSIPRSPSPPPTVR